MTIKKALVIPIMLAFILAVVPVLAKNSGNNNVVSLPDKAVDKAGHVFDLGTAIDPATGKTVQGYAIVKYKGKKAKPDHAGGPKDKGGGGSTCYAFMAKGAKWKNVENWVVNGSNSEGLSENFVFNNMDANITKWENEAGRNIIGSGSQTNVKLVADTASPDDVNEVYFADISSQGAVGVTIVWGVFGGPPHGRYLAEWDQIYDDTDYDWGIGDAYKMDFESISTHELGHTFGLSDLYDTACNEETMYGYVAEGQTHQRSLNSGDIAGIVKLYE